MINIHGIMQFIKQTKIQLASFINISRNSQKFVNQFFPQSLNVTQSEPVIVF